MTTITTAYNLNPDLQSPLDERTCGLDEHSRPHELARYEGLLRYERQPKSFFVADDTLTFQPFSSSYISDIELNNYTFHVQAGNAAEDVVIVVKSNNSVVASVNLGDLQNLSSLAGINIDNYTLQSDTQNVKLIQTGLIDHLNLSFTTNPTTGAVTFFGGDPYNNKLFRETWDTAFASTTAVQHQPIADRVYSVVNIVETNDIVTLHADIDDLKNRMSTAEQNILALYLNPVIASLLVTSDDRLKHNETTLTNALGTLRQLTPTQYLKSKEIGVDEPVESMTEEAGFIAQEVLQIPELRFAVSHGDYTVTSDDGEVTTVTRPYHLSYNSILTYAVKAIQELDTQLQSALTRIQELEARVQ